jgi:hypothetical protein
VADRVETGGAPGATAAFGELARPLRARLTRPRFVDLARRLDVIGHRIRTLGLARTAEDLASVAAELRRLGQADETESS